MSGFGKFLGGFILGGALGGLVAILFAPMSGEETRKKIGTESMNAYKSVENKIGDLHHKTEKSISELQKTGEEVLNKIKEAVSKSDKVVENTK